MSRPGQVPEAFRPGVRRLSLVAGVLALLAAAVALGGVTQPGAGAPAGSEQATGQAVGSRVFRPRIVERWIPFGPRRKHQMAAYSRRHYGQREWRLRHPRQIVEHIAVAGSASAVRNAFVSNRPDPELGELPNVCAHFVVSSAGRIYQLVGLNKRCRHTVGLNQASIGIEHVGFRDRDLLGNRRELRASVRLTRWLRCRYGIAVKDVIGHRESLRSRFHREKVRRLRHQTHGDMRHRSMQRYRRQLRQAGRCPR